MSGNESVLQNKIEPGDYSGIVNFVRENNNITYERFDASTVNKVNLFALRESFDFDALESLTDTVIKELPALKRIFSKPIIRLRDTGDILPVESVRVVNNKTIEHASRHSELWESISEEGLKPKKLLTIKHEDDYAIYENIVFAETVNKILSFVSKNIRTVTDMLYTDRIMHFNLLERVNHLQYFLAIGKLHIGYVRDYGKHRPQAERCLDKLLFVERILRARVNTPVYKKCRKYSPGAQIKKTNIFRMHKDYHRVYLLFKRLTDADLCEEKEAVSVSHNTKAGYVLFSSMITLFAAGHFNFIFDENEKINFYAMKQHAEFSRWKLKVETIPFEGNVALLLSFKKDKEYKIALVPSINEEEGTAAVALSKKIFFADEYITALPTSESKSGSMCISLFDIESFRRVQQLILRGMIYSDTERDVCPFCGLPLSSTERNADVAYECQPCRTQILHLTCPETNEIYFATKIKNYSPSREEYSRSASKDSLLYAKYVESQLHFRNITAIADGEAIVCPKCGESHAR